MHPLSINSNLSYPPKETTKWFNRCTPAGEQDFPTTVPVVTMIIFCHHLLYKSVVQPEEGRDHGKAAEQVTDWSWLGDSSRWHPR